MLRSLYSGVSGMRGFQTKMDVIANNIANVNTTGFKSGRAGFQDMLSQTVAHAQSPTQLRLGGVNTQQVGLGVKVGSIDTIMTGGALQPTNRDLDFAIEGQGFFVVTEARTEKKGGDTDDLDPIIKIKDDDAVADDDEETNESILPGLGTPAFFTRDGTFFTDHEGNLVNANGMRVLGYTYQLSDDTGNADGDMYNPHKVGGDADELNLPKPDTLYNEEGKLRSEVYGAEDNDEDYFGGLTSMKIPMEIEGKDGEKLKLEDFNIDGAGQVVGIYSDGNAYNLGKLAMVRFSNPEGLTKASNNNYVRSNNSGEPFVGQAGEQGFGYIRQGFLEMSNVDLANEFTEMIVASRAYQANSRSITTSDEMLQELINLKR